jgi:hypothetical protein
MTSQSSFRTDLLLHQSQQVRRSQPDDIRTLCEIGRQLAQDGLTQETRNCYRAAVDALRRLIHAGNVNLALTGEDSIYTAFVNNVEDEQHYYRCFADWKDDLAALGRRFRDPAALSRGGADQIAYFLHSGHILGHTEVLLKMLESRPRTGQRCVEPRVCILDRYSPAFVERCRAAGVEVVPVIDALGPGAPWEARFLWLRQRFQQDRVGVCVGVSPHDGCVCPVDAACTGPDFLGLALPSRFRTIHRRLHNLRRETGARAIDWKAVMEGRPGAADHCHDAGRF